MERPSISWELFNIFSWNFAKMFLVLLWKSSHKKTFPWHVLLHWESVWGIFWPVLVYTFLFVEICSIFLLKILHSCRMKKNLLHNLFSLDIFLQTWGSFLGTFRPILVTLLNALINSIFSHKNMGHSLLETFLGCFWWILD